jgi:hypothetical protein
MRGPKRIFLSSLIIYSKNIALPLATSVKKSRKSFDQFSVLSVEKRYSFFSSSTNVSAISSRLEPASFYQHF